MNLTEAALTLSLLNNPTITNFDPAKFLIVANDGSSDPVTGMFASSSGLSSGCTATADYAY